jgi:RNA-splicing ligase RtcB
MMSARVTELPTRNVRLDRHSSRAARAFFTARIAASSFCSKARQYLASWVPGLLPDYFEAKFQQKKTRNGAMLRLVVRQAHA